MKLDWKTAFMVVDFPPRMPFSMEKFHFCGCPTLAKVMLDNWNEELIAVSCLLNLTPLGLPHIKRGQPWSMATSRVKVNSTLTRSFQHELIRKSCEVTLFPASINKEQLKDWHNYSFRKMIAAINIVGGSTSGDN